MVALVVTAGVLGALGLGGVRSSHAQEPAQGPVPEGVELVRGANLVVYQGPTMDVAGGLNNIAGVVIVVWAFEADVQLWLLWAVALPDALQGFEDLEQGRPYFIIVAARVTWVFPLPRAITDMPPLVFLTVGDQIFLPERGSYCWPESVGVAICVDALPPSIDRFFSLEGGPIRLSWDEPFPDSFTVRLLQPNGDSTDFDDAFRDASVANWFPDAPAGDYILMVTAVWSGLPDGGGGDASYFFGIRIDEGGLFTPVEVLAPILSVVKGVVDGEVATYFLTIESALPNGCHEFSRLEVEISGTTVTVTVFNLAPPPEAPIACIQIFRTEFHTVELGEVNPETVIVNGEQFEV